MRGSKRVLHRQRPTLHAESVRDRDKANLLLSAFTEPIVYALGAPAVLAEPLGLLTLPLLPAIGAAWECRS